VIPDSCRSNFQPFYLHPPHAPPSYAHCARRRPGRGFAAFPFGSTSVLGFAFPSQARQCIRPYRVHHFLNYGLVVRFRLLPTPPLGDAVAFCYGQPVLCPTGTFTPLLVRTLRRTRGAACSSWAPGCCKQRPSGALREDDFLNSWLLEFLDLLVLFASASKAPCDSGQQQQSGLSCWHRS